LREQPPPPAGGTPFVREGGKKRAADCRPYRDIICNPSKYLI